MNGCTVVIPAYNEAATIRDVFAGGQRLPAPVGLLVDNEPSVTAHGALG